MNDYRDYLQTRIAEKGRQIDKMYLRLKWSVIISIPVIIAISYYFFIHANKMTL